MAPACPLKPWVRFVGYNGYPNHGDPAHCSGGCGAHIHVSWYASSYGNSALSPPNAWVRVFPVPTTSGNGGSSVPVSAPAAAGAPSRTIAVVGDSLAAGTQPDLKDDLPGWQIFTDAEAGRPLADGMRIVEAIEGTPAVLAISLFTNDDPRHTSELAAAVRRSVQGQRCVLWATIHRPPVAGVSYAAANRTLHRLDRRAARPARRRLGRAGRPAPRLDRARSRARDRHRLGRPRPPLRHRRQPMRHLNHSRSQKSARGLLATALITVAVTVAGCGSDNPSSDVRRVVDDSARAAAATTRLSHELMRRWCPHAIEHHGRGLTRRQARRCLARAHRAWLRELHRDGYDPKRVGAP